MNTSTDNTRAKKDATRSTVVVGVDGSADGERAVRYGTALARHEGLDLRLVHVPHGAASYAPAMPYLPPITVQEIGDSVLQDAAKNAEEACADASRITTVLAEGPRTAGLLKHVQDARCIVLGTRASTVQHLMTGATSLSVAAHSPVPVHCVPRSWADNSDASGRVVVGIDGSNADAQVLDGAFFEAAQRGATLEVVHAWRPVSPYDAAIMGRVLRDDWEKSAGDTLAPGIDAVAASHPGVSWTLHLDYERVPLALHTAAVNADLLVLGRRGHNGPMGLLLGSNTRTLVHNATCPVVVVPVRFDTR
jgi:nucleotide-binding universal stress UspA family protein